MYIPIQTFIQMSINFVSLVLMAKTFGSLTLKAIGNGIRIDLDIQHGL